MIDYLKQATFRNISDNVQIKCCVNDWSEENIRFSQTKSLRYIIQFLMILHAENCSLFMVSDQTNVCSALILDTSEAEDIICLQYCFMW